jgi:TolA-binding protein
LTTRTAISLLLVASLVFTTGCVYYNTFYHARAASREAALMREERPPGSQPGPAEKELLERVAEKCGRVLQLHPDSDWADDALLLLGTTHYYQERYETAERRLTEFLSHHPDSDLRPDAEYMLASVLLARGNPVSAETTLEGLVAAEPPHALSDDALALVGRARNERKKYEEAAEAYTRALERFPRSDRRAEIRFLAAENYEEAGDLDSAAREFALVPTERGSRTYAFEARMRLAEVDLERGRPVEALEVLEELEPRVESRDERDRVLLLKGRALVDAGRIDDAIETYEGISASHKRSEASGEANYRIGIIRRDHFEQLEEAVESFRSARDEAPRTEVAAKASEASEDVTKLIGFLRTIEEAKSAEADTIGGETSEQQEALDAPPAGAVIDTAGSATILPPGEFIDEATTLADSLLAEPAPVDTTSTETAGAETFELADAGVDTVESAEAGGDTLELADAGADTAGAAEAGDEDEVDEVAVAHFRAAELYLFRFEDPDRASVHYTAVIDEHPESPLAPKAALALAWILESESGDRAEALAVYRSVIDDYPGTEYEAAAAEAIERLGEAESETPDATPSTTN